jgi:hypothetical protein
MNAPVATLSLADIEIVVQPDVLLINELVAYWERKRTGRFAPRRAEIDPTELGPHLPHVFMVDVLQGGADFRFRLIGTEIVKGLGRDSTGMRFSELYRGQPEALQKLLAIFRTIIEEKRPVFGRGSVFWLPSRDTRRFAVGFLPLSDDGVSVNIVLSELFIFWS